MRYNTVDYLYKNRLHITTAMDFTIRNICYLKNNRLHEMTLTSSMNPEKEDLCLFDLVDRLKDLYKLAEPMRITSGIYDTSEKYMSNLDKIFKDLEKDFHINLTFDKLDK
ncbi:MAG: hypothetical protein GY777_29520 [Candidatus Brocadiaceae bacterium]|nr:hypothetical protein [Candidatus Brocadiaceae bacterium]